MNVDFAIPTPTVSENGATADHARLFRQAALRYRQWGFNLVPLGADKRPVVTDVSQNGALLRFRWDAWQQERQTDERWAKIKQPAWWKDVRGLGGICGPVSGNLVCIDFDTPKDRTDLKFPIAVVERLLAALGLTGTTWMVDSPRGGFHVWVLCAVQIEKGKLDRAGLDLPDGYHIELRWTGHYAALPGSLHPNGVYRWHGAAPDEAPPAVEADALLAAYDCVTVVTEAKRSPVGSTAGANGNGAPGGAYSPSASYAAAALDEELRGIRQAGDGKRNETLNRAAFSLGQLVGAGLLSQGETEDALVEAALAVGLNEGEALATVRSGMRSGMDKPRTVSPLNGNGNAAGAEPYAWAFAPSSEQPPVLDVDHLPDLTGMTEEDDDGEGRTSLSQRISRDLAAWGFALALCELDDTVEVNGRQLDDNLEAHIRMTARNHRYGSKNGIPLAALADQMRVDALRSSYHPVKRYLEGLSWDGSDRLAALAEHVKDKHTPITYADGCKEQVFKAWLWRWMVGAIAKVYGAGSIRAQNPMLVLSGAQNLGKSTLAAWLCPMPDLFIESGINPDSADHLRYLVTKWVWEVGELGATTRRSDREALKAFLTRQEATFRKPYDHHSVTKAALASFIGTVNPMNNGFLDDPTGSRRFLVVNLASIDHGYVRTVDRDQLWAQAMAAYCANPQAWQLTPEERAQRDSANAENEVERPYEGLLVRLFEIDPLRTDWWTPTSEIVDALRTYGEAAFDETRHHGVLGITLRGLGLERKQRQQQGDRVWGYYGLQLRVRPWKEA